MYISGESSIYKKKKFVHCTDEDQKSDTIFFIVYYYIIINNYVINKQTQFIDTQYYTGLTLQFQ